MHLIQSTIATLLAASSVRAATVSKVLKRSAEPEIVNGTYIVDRQTQFNNHKSWTFTGSSLPSGLEASDYTIGNSQVYLPANAYVQNGYLNLLVNGGQTSKPYKGGEVVTTISNIKYASVRTVAILTEPAGVCNGMFFYKSDTQEIDVEWLSDAKSQSNGGTRKLWFTNQDANGDGQDTHLATTPPTSPTSTEHEYRIDWTSGLVKWFVDGVQIWQTTQDVPTTAGSWIWNNWSNGDKGWSAGPPAQDALFKIRSIDLYYNTA